MIILRCNGKSFTNVVQSCNVIIMEFLIEPVVEVGLTSSSPGGAGRTEKLVETLLSPPLKRG